MTKFAISPEGAEALRTLSGRLIDSLNEIESASNQLDAERKSLSAELGLYESSLGDLVADCRKAIREKARHVSELAENLVEKAAIIESLIGLDDSFLDSESERTRSFYKTKNNATSDEQSRQWNETFIPLVKANIRKGVEDHFAEYITEEKLESSLEMLEFMNQDELARRYGSSFQRGILGYNDGSVSNIASDIAAPIGEGYGDASSTKGRAINFAFVTAVHETMHMMSANDTPFRTKRGIMRREEDRALNEAITEYYTYISTGGDTPLGGLYPGTYSSYTNLRNVIPVIESFVGSGCLKEAYFHNRPDLVCSKIDQKCGLGTWDCLCRDFYQVQYSEFSCNSERMAAAARIKTTLEKLR